MFGAPTPVGRICSRSLRIFPPANAGMRPALASSAKRGRGTARKRGGGGGQASFAQGFEDRGKLDRMRRVVAHPNDFVLSVDQKW